MYGYFCSMSDKNTTINKFLLWTISTDTLLGTNGRRPRLRANDWFIPLTSWFYHVNCSSASILAFSWHKMHIWMPYEKILDDSLSTKSVVMFYATFTKNLSLRTALLFFSFLQARISCSTSLYSSLISTSMICLAINWMKQKYSFFSSHAKTNLLIQPSHDALFFYISRIQNVSWSSCSSQSCRYVHYNNNNKDDDYESC